MKCLPRRAPWLLPLLLALAAGCAAAPAARPATTSAPPTAPLARSAGAGSPAAAATSGGAAPAFDERAVADFYRGKTVRIVVGFAAGGGFDIASRLLARYLGRHIPGNPTVIVENVPGGSSMVAMNQVYNTAPKDGTVIANVSGGLVLQQLFGAAGVQYDVTRVHYLGTPAVEQRLLLVTRASGFTRFADVLSPSGKQLVLGSPPPGTGAYDAAAVVRDVLGANIKLVSGYDGLAKVRLAMEQGEVDGFVNTWESVKSTDLERVESGEWLVLTQLTDTPIKDLPNAPGILTFAQTDEQRRLLRFGAIATSQIVRLYLLAPGVPGDRVQALESAFTQTLADPDLQAEAERSKIDLAPLSGPQLQSIIADFLGASDDVKATLRGILAPQGG